MTFRDKKKRRRHTRESPSEFTVFLTVIWRPWLSSSQFSPLLSVSRSRPNWLSSQFPICLKTLVPCWELLAVLTTVPYLTRNQALGSVPRFLVGTCWWFGLQFPICLESVHSRHVGSTPVQAFLQPQVACRQSVMVCTGPFSWTGHSNWLWLECYSIHVCLSSFV